MSADGVEAVLLGGGEDLVARRRAAEADPPKGRLSPELRDALQQYTRRQLGGEERFEQPDGIGDLYDCPQKLPPMTTSSTLSTSSQWPVV